MRKLILLSLFAAFFVVSPATAQITCLNSNCSTNHTSTSAGSGTTGTINTTGATLLVVGCASYGSTSVTDSGATQNTWIAGTVDIGSYGQGQLFYALSPHTGTSHSITCSGGGPWTSFSAWAGTNIAFDKQAGGSGVNVTGSSFTPSTTGELIINLFQDQSDGDFNPGTPSAFTSIGEADSSAYGAFSAAYLIDSSSSSLNPGWPNTNFGGSLAIMAFKQSAGSVPSITSATTTTFTVGTAGSFSVTGSNTPTSFAETGTLPSGVTFNTSTGVLSGTPAAGTGGSYSLSLTATNGSGTSSPQTFTLIVDQTPVFTSTASTTFTTGTAGNYSVTATGYPAPTFTETGSLPGGVTLSTSGVLSGTPSVSGSFSITITASNGVGTAPTQSFTLTVNAGVTYYALSTTTTGTGSGTFGGSNCTSNNYTSGTSITCTPSASTGSALTALSGTGSASGCSGTSCTFSLTSSATVTATFTLQSYALTVTAPTNGTITNTVNCTTGSVAYGATVTCGETPNSGYTFTGWSGGTCSGTGACSFTMPAAAATVTATFTATGSGGPGWYRQ